MSSVNATSATVSAAPKRRRRFRFGLRGLIVLVTHAAIVFGVFGPFLRTGIRQRGAIKTITALGGVVVLRSPTSSIDRFIPLRRGPWHEYFGQYGRRQLVDADIPTIAAALIDLTDVQVVAIESTSVTDDGLLLLRDVLPSMWLELRCPLVTSRSVDALQQKAPELLILDD